MNSSYIRHVIWDFNGTLFDDLGLCVEILADTCREHSVEPIDRNTYRSLFCHPVMDFYRKMGLLPGADFEVLSHDFHDRYERDIEKCALQNGAVEILHSFRSRGLTQSILSALPHDILERIIIRHNLGGYFIDILGSKDRYAHGKVEAAREWMIRQEYKPEEILLVGDTNHDAEVAEALGVHCALLTHGFQERKILERCKVPLYDSLGDLENRLRAGGFTNR